MKRLGVFSKAEVARQFAHAGDNAVRIFGAVAMIVKSKPTKRGKTKSPICKRKMK